MILVVWEQKYWYLTLWRRPVPCMWLAFRTPEARVIGEWEKLCALGNNQVSPRSNYWHSTFSKNHTLTCSKLLSIEVFLNTIQWICVVFNIFFFSQKVFKVNDCLYAKLQVIIARITTMSCPVVCEINFATTVQQKLFITKYIKALVRPKLLQSPNLAKSLKRIYHIMFMTVVSHISLREYMW